MSLIDNIEKRIVNVVIFCLSVHISTDKPFELNEFITFGHSQYLFSVLPLTWIQASEKCQRNGAQLVSIETYKEDAFLTKKNIAFADKYRT